MDDLKRVGQMEMVCANHKASSSLGTESTLPKSVTVCGFITLNIINLTDSATIDD
jgi:hypothetical protein